MGSKCKIINNITRKDKLKVQLIYFYFNNKALVQLIKYKINNLNNNK